MAHHLPHRARRPSSSSSRSCTATRQGSPSGGLQDWLLKIDLTWAQELCIYMFVWMAKFGAAYGVRTGIHVGVDVLINALKPERARQVHHLRPARRGAVHRHHRHASAPTSSGKSTHTDQVLGRPRTADSGSCTACDPARLLPDVLPFLQVAWASSAPANCRTTTTGTSRARQGRPKSTCRRLMPIGSAPATDADVNSAPGALQMSGAHHLRAADRPDADRHADLDLARPHRSHVPLHDDRRADRVGGAEAVHRHREVRDHGDSVLHPGRQLPDPRRRGEADDHASPPRWSATGTAAWPRRCDGVRAVRRGVGLLARRPWSRSARSCCRRWSRQGFPKRFGAGVITTSGALGILIPPSIAMVIYAVSTNTSVGRAVHRRHRPGHHAGHAARAGHLVSRARNATTRACSEPAWSERIDGVPRERLGPAADRHRHRRHLRRHFHADRGRRDERRLCVFRRRVRLQGHALEGRAARCCSTSANYERDAALHHHQRGAVLVPA